MKKVKNYEYQKRSAQANNLRNLRKQRGLTIQEVIDATGITYSALQQYETGKRTPRAKNLQILSDYYNVDKAFIYGISDVLRESDVMEASEFDLTPHEVAIIKGYRDASAGIRDGVAVILGIYKAKKNPG